MKLPAICESVVVADFETELVVLVPERRKAHLLEPAWALLFDSCRRGDDGDRLIDEVAAADGGTPAEVESWVQRALTEFSRLGIVASAEPGSV